jgi:hypothetical protein
MTGTDWITWNTLMTFGGAVAVVTLVSQFLKDALDQAFKLPTRLLVLVIAWIVLLARDAVLTGGLTWSGAFLDFLNGFLVALTAMGTHAFAKTNLKWK